MFFVSARLPLEPKLFLQEFCDRVLRSSITQCSNFEATFDSNAKYRTQHNPNCDHDEHLGCTLDLLTLTPYLIHCVCNLFSFLVHFVTNIPDVHHDHNLDYAAYGEKAHFWD